MVATVGVIGHGYPEDGKTIIQDIGSSKAPQSDCLAAPAGSPFDCSTRLAAGCWLRQPAGCRLRLDPTPTRPRRDGHTADETAVPRRHHVQCHLSLGTIREVTQETSMTPTPCPHAHLSMPLHSLGSKLAMPLYIAIHPSIQEEGLTYTTSKLASKRASYPSIHPFPRASMPKHHMRPCSWPATKACLVHAYTEPDAHGTAPRYNSRSALFCPMYTPDIYTQTCRSRGIISPESPEPG